MAPDQQAKAAVYYERALSKGDKTVRTRLGLLYRDGIGVPANPDKARDLLKSAAEDGDRWAMFHLAQGHLKHQFGSASQPSEAVKLLEESRNAGNPNAVAALSNLYMWGRGGVRRDPKRAVALLEAAADKGNAVAARNLIAIYRDGRGRLISRDRRRAPALLQKYANLFDPDALRTENLLTENNRTENSSAREVLAESYIKADPATRRRILLSLRTTKPNSYVFLLQHRLTSAGIYSGQLNGQLNRATIRALNQFCRTENISDACRRGPLSSRAAAALAGTLK